MGVKRGMVSQKITRIACCSAILFLSQIVLKGLPNIEIVSVLVIALTVVFGKEMMITTIVFAMLEVVVYGVGLWTIMYLYVWNVLVVCVLLLRKEFGDSPMSWAILAMIYGLSFGALTAVVYSPLGLTYTVTWWIAGVKYDIIHGVSNFITTLCLYRPLVLALRRIKKELYE